MNVSSESLNARISVGHTKVKSLVATTIHGQYMPYTASTPVRYAYIG